MHVHLRIDQGVAADRFLTRAAGRQIQTSSRSPLDNRDAHAIGPRAVDTRGSCPRQAFDPLLGSCGVQKPDIRPRRERCRRKDVVGR
jgi:hypothetical protein